MYLVKLSTMKNHKTQCVYGYKEKLLLVAGVDQHNFWHLLTSPNIC